ncbi:MAG: DUF4276 family protein [Candidatus Parabeggiatoa sp.]|nr:DUF4276 family protein [Candidatus Parabeggiatoa sp.]
MRHIEFILEEASSEAALQILVPKIIERRATFACHVMGGKKTLLKELPARLRGYSRWLPPDWRIVVLIDRDEQACQALKARLEEVCQQAGLISKSIAEDKQAVQVINRIIIEELEAWFFGDVRALRQAYPRFPDISQKAAFRNPDKIRGGTWETLERLLQKSGYYKGGLQKIDLAKSITPYMEPVRNTSKSFQSFRQALLEWLA